MPDVDSIWAEMQQEHSKKLTKRVVKAADLSSLQRERAAPRKKPVAKKLDASLQWLVGTPAGGYPAANDVTNDLGTSGQMKLLQPPSTLIDAMDTIPTETPEIFLAYLQRDINCLGEDNLGVRLQSLQKLERVLVQNVDNLSTDIIDAVADAFTKPLLKRMKDKSEKCRELTARILKSIVENASDLGPLLAYIFPTLVARLGCEDLDGVAHLPEIMRPDPEQKPTEIARPVEESEEVRLELAYFVRTFLLRCNTSQVYSYVDEATGLLRAQCMDPFHEVKAYACESLISFCHNHSELLLHFTEPLGRSLTSCLTHNHARIRILGLRAVTAVFRCGKWKHNHEVFQHLMAWQDPNKCAIKAFYEPVTKINYLSTLSFDRHPAVRRFYFETLAYWLLSLEDKVDHEPYIFPYLLTGLCDENDEIALETFWLIERCGELYEREKEEDLRKQKQYGFDLGWTYSGRATVPFPLRGLWAGGGLCESIKRTAAHGPDIGGKVALEDHRRTDRMLDEGDDADLGEQIPLPERDYAWPEVREVAVFRKLPRPRLGARLWVRTHCRRYIKATFNDVVDFRDCTALNAGRLLCMSIAYTEEGVTEWLQPMTAALIKFYSGRAWAAGDTKVTRTFDAVCKLLGAFLDPVSYWPQMKEALDSESVWALDQRIAALRVLALHIEGSVITLRGADPGPDLAMGRLTPVIPELISMMHESDLLLAPSEECRDVMWSLLDSFVADFCEFLTFSQVSQLLYIALALSAKAAPDALTELASQGSFVEAPQFEEEELVKQERLDRLLDKLSTRAPCEEEAEAPKASAFSLDSLDDDFEEEEPPQAPEVSSDPRVVHKNLFKQAFAELLARLEDSFQVFRSILYLSPLSVLASVEHRPAVLERLAAFCGKNAAPTVRQQAHNLAAHTALRCAKALAGCSEGSAAGELRNFMYRLFTVSAKAHLDGAANVKKMSYTVTASGLAVWRRFFLCRQVDPCCALFCSGSKEASTPLQWLTSLFEDQELYKKYHQTLEHAETIQSGQAKADFVVAKAKNIREEAESRSNVVRLFAGSILLLVLRRILADGKEVPWITGTKHGSAHATFWAAASLFRSATPKLAPPFVKPTPASLLLYSVEIMHLLCHPVPGKWPRPFQLRDDANRMILHPPASPLAANPPLSMTEEESERLATDFIGALVDLNLTLPPDPDAKHVPTTLAEGESDEVLLGWDVALEQQGGSDFDIQASASSGRREAAVPREVTRVLAQTPECLKWNAAYALYIFGVDLAELCKDGLQAALVKWRRRNEQAKVLICMDVLARASRALKTR